MSNFSLLPHSLLFSSSLNPLVNCPIARSETVSFSQKTLYMQTLTSIPHPIYTAMMSEFCFLGRHGGHVTPLVEFEEEGFIEVRNDEDIQKRLK